MNSTYTLLTPVPEQDERPHRQSVGMSLDDDLESLCPHTVGHATHSAITIDTIYTSNTGWILANM